MLSLLIEKGMRMTNTWNSWHVLFYEIGNGWAQAPDEEKILQLDTISRLLVAKENCRGAIGTPSWQCLVHMLSKDWLSGSIELQRVLKTTMFLFLKRDFDRESAPWKETLWHKIMFEVDDAINGLDLSPASMEIILETMIIFLRHGASLDANHVNLILALRQNPCYSMEQKAELRKMLPSDHIDSLDLPYRLHPVPEQTLDNPGQRLKRSAPDSGSESETGSLDQRPLKRPFQSIYTTTHPWSPKYSRFIA